MRYTVQLDNGDRIDYEAASGSLALKTHKLTYRGPSPVRYVVSETTAIEYYDGDPSGEWSGVAYPSA